MLAKLIGRALLIFGLVSFSLPAYADSVSYHLSVDSGSHLWLDGNSTLHKFEIETSTLNLTSGTFTTSSPDSIDVSSMLGQIAGSFVLTIPAQSLTNPEPGFNKNLWRALKYQQNPNIVFSMASTTATPDPSGAGTYDVTAQGTLTIAGAQRSENLSAVFVAKGNTIRITGSKQLLMSDFGIKPPTMFFGTIKTDDLITVRWDITLSSN